jgi:rifampicin phosphotransferase
MKVKESMKPIIGFDTRELPRIDQAGGKGFSLIRMTQEGLPVPPGFILPVAFFDPWIHQLKRTDEWDHVLDSPESSLPWASERLKAKCAGLEFNTNQKATLDEAVGNLLSKGTYPLFAVRSSSPEEDLESASFAGGYETRLGVTVEHLEEAIRRSFASVFDARVYLYKREHGFPVEEPRIAVVVQEQIASEVAGVAFSLNPLSNCYDEAVITANFGLGESVVSGLASPDTLVIDKVSGQIIEQKIGKKETSIWLAPDGGTFTEPARDRNRCSLSPEQALDIASLVSKIERAYQKPVDIEWAIDRGKIFLLQVRPITAYFPLPESLRTRPGEPKILYVDLSLTKWGMNEPLSVLGEDFLALASAAMLRTTLGDVTPETVKALRVSAGGRTYINLTNTLKLQGKRKWVEAFRTQDALVAQIVTRLDEKEYIRPETPPELKGLVFKALHQNLGTGWQVLQGIRYPEVLAQKALDEGDRLQKTLEQLARDNGRLSWVEFAQASITALMHYIDTFMPTIYASVLAINRLRAVFAGDPESTQQISYLERALPHNITVRMGLAMYRLSQYPEVQAGLAPEIFISRLQAGDVSAEFARAWQDFLLTYGFRSPMEMDVAAPRYHDQPERLYSLLFHMAENAGAEGSPESVYEKARARREETAEELKAIAARRSRQKARQFEKWYQVLVALGGFRETGKYYYVLMTDSVRQRALTYGNELVAAGRLDRAEQVFDLTFKDLDFAAQHPGLDLRKLAAENTAYKRKFAQVRNFPRVIDSRGKILRPPARKSKEGELAGEPISPGTARGRVKVLLTPDEKPVLPGEILVTRATDPGWTPLFLNAAAIVLEVGGLLQHGALVAREYGKPCVAGIENITSLLKDGQMIEVDGSSGILYLTGTNGREHEREEVRDGSQIAG